MPCVPHVYRNKCKDLLVVWKSSPAVICPKNVTVYRVKTCSVRSYIMKNTFPENAIILQPRTLSKHFLSDSVLKQNNAEHDIFIITKRISNDVIVENLVTV